MSKSEFLARPFWKRRIIGFFEGFIYPTFGQCFRCRASWGAGPERWHTTHYCACGYDAERRHHGGTCVGCFALCEPCWRELGSGEARWPYYAALIDLWKKLDCLPEPGALQAMHKAVLSE